MLNETLMLTSLTHVREKKMFSDINFWCRWKFAVHGCIDGYSRLIVYIKCNNSMTAANVIPYFALAVAEYGVPSRVRSDHGYENYFVALLMNSLRGLGRGSHITGKSVHNQRIERLWVDVYTQVVDYFYREFYNLEEQGLLNIEDDYHMFALHKVYSRSINERLKCFQTAWNSHTLRTVNKTPRQMWISGMLSNIDSGHTATEEVFNEHEDLYNRVLQAFERYNLNVNVLNVVEETPSNLSFIHSIHFNDDIIAHIQSILERPIDDKEKFTQIISIIR